MTKNRAELERLLLRAWFEILLRRGLQWFGFAAILLSLGTGFSLLLSPPLRIYTAYFLILVSTLPIFLLWPCEASRLAQALRQADRDSAIEAWLESGNGPAKELLSRRAASRFEELAYSPRARRRSWRALAPLYSTAALSLLILQIASILWQGQPILIYSGPPLQAGSGQRMDEQAFGPEFAEDPAARLALQDGIDSEKMEAEGEAGEGFDAQKDASRKSNLENFGLGALSTGREGGNEGKNDRMQPEAQVGGQSRELEPGEGEGPDGAALEGEGEAEGGSRPVERRPGSATGFEDGGSSGIPSPLVDYRSRFFKILAERTKKEAEASGELSLGELKDFERRYFASFGLSTGLGPVEEAYAALLKRRWKQLWGQKK